MVRAHLKQQTEEKKESSASEKKRIVTKQKKSHETGVWPCKINGCNKEFAREADLKRHQRTTKVHSVPGFSVACPQCEATFTRTDALRRHQKSRHNGIILDPISPSQAERMGEDDEARSGGSRSREGTPSRRGVGASTSILVPTTAPVTTTLTRPDSSSIASGATSYYRQHTGINPVFTPPRTPHGVLEPFQITQVPTSSARLHPTTWPPAPPWIQENPSLPRGSTTATIPYTSQATPYYAPGSYYRTPAPPVSVSVSTTALSTQQETAPSEQERQNDTSVSPRFSPTVSPDNIDPSLAGPRPSNTSQPTNTEHDADRSSSYDSLTDEAKLTTAIRVLEAVLSGKSNGTVVDPPAEESNNDSNMNVGPADDEAKEVKVAQLKEVTANGTPTSINGPTTKSKDAEMDADADGEADLDGEGEANQTPNADQVMTDNGTPMLRPDELLNEESLASPPP